jgi:hypothetical protein
MDGPEPGLASVTLDGLGRYLDGDATALEIYGVSLDELRAHRVGDFSAAGLAQVHRALFLWLAHGEHDFGGGQGTIVTPAGRRVRIECRSLTRVGDAFRMEFRALDGELVQPHSEDLAAVLDAWRTADREARLGRASTGAESGRSALAGEVASALRGVYHYVFERKSERGEQPDPSAPATPEGAGI